MGCPQKNEADACGPGLGGLASLSSEPRTCQSHSAGTPLPALYGHGAGCDPALLHRGPHRAWESTFPYCSSQPARPETLRPGVL